MCGCKENIEKESPCKCQENNYENGGSIDSERRFSESDYNRLIESTLFKGRWTGFVWEIYPSEGGNVLGKFNPKTKTLFIAGKKDKSNPLVEWLQNNSHVSMEEYQKLKHGGIPSKNWDKYEEGGAVVGGFSLVYQKWSDIMGGNGVSGTIRTTPANYYVATIDENGDIIFDYIEAMTRDIDVAKVRNLWENNLIPEEKKRYDDGGNVDSFKIIKDDFKVMPSEPNRVYHTIEGTYGDYWFVAKTDNSHKFGYGSDGINKGCVYKLDLWFGGNPVGREQSTKGGHVSEDYVASYFNKWDYKPSTHKHKMAVVKIVDFLENNICDLRREYTSIKFKKGGDVPVKVYEVKYYGKSHLAKKGKLRGNYSTYIKASSREEAIRLAKKDDSDFAELIHSKPTKLNPEFMENGGMTGNYEIEIIENSERKKRWKGVVSKYTYNKIESLKNSGGFLRYDIDLYDDNSSEKADNSGLYEFMNDIGIKLTSTLPTVDPKRVYRLESGGEAGGKYYILMDDGSKEWFNVKRVQDVPNVYFLSDDNWLGIGTPTVHRLNALRPLYLKSGKLAEKMPEYAGMSDRDINKDSFANGGTTQSLEKELIKLQRELNSSRLRTYREGDNSEEEMARKAEREVKLARFNEILKLLNENGNKYSYGGGVSNEISKQQLESMVGRSLNGWNDDVVYHNGEKYSKCFLRPYYKKA